MKKTTYRTSVHLKELTAEGETFFYSDATGELTATLKDLINSHGYSVNLQVRPIGNAFEISGKIETSLDLQCARCGREMRAPFYEDFNELIVVMEERPRAGHSGHTGGQEVELFCNYLTSYHLNLADFVHEHIAASQPYAPYCGRPDCEDYFKSIQLTTDEAPNTEQQNPFAVLKNLPLKSQRG